MVDIQNQVYSCRIWPVQHRPLVNVANYFGYEVEYFGGRPKRFHAQYCDMLGPGKQLVANDTACIQLNGAPQNVTNTGVVKRDIPAPKINPQAGCNAVYIFVDAPRFATSKGLLGSGLGKWSTVKENLVQKIILVDASQPGGNNKDPLKGTNVVAVVDHSLTLEFDSAGNFLTNH